MRHTSVTDGSAASPIRRLGDGSKPSSIQSWDLMSDTNSRKTAQLMPSTSSSSTGAFSAALATICSSICSTGIRPEAASPIARSATTAWPNLRFSASRSSVTRSTSRTNAAARSLFGSPPRRTRRAQSTNPPSPA